MRQRLISWCILVGTMAAAPAWAAGLKSDRLGNIFEPDQPVVFGLSGLPGQAHWRVTDFFGKIVASGPVDDARSIRPRLPDTGYYTLDVTADNAADLPVQTTFAILPRPLDSPGNASPFGVVTHFAKGWDPGIIPLIARAGIRHVRDEQPWRKLEKTHGDFNFDAPNLSAYMADLARYGIDPLIELVFANPLYDDGKTPFSDAGREAYAAYARAVADHYRAQLAKGGGLEIWNEYNGSFCDGPCNQDRPRYYAQMLASAYRAIKQTAPEITVLGGAGVPIPLPFFQKLFKQGALDTMDALVIHPYRPTPEGVEDKISELRRMMAASGSVKPIWATEFGDFPDMHSSRENEARYLVRMSTLMLSAGVDRMYWYLFEDFEQFTGLGLIRGPADPLGAATPTPAYVAYATLIRELAGTKFIRREVTGDNIHAYLFEGNSKKVRVIWSEAENYVAMTGMVHIKTIVGADSVTDGNQDVHNVAVSQTPLFVEGGEMAR